MNGSTISNKVLFWKCLMDSVYKDTLKYKIIEDEACTQIRIFSKSLSSVRCNLFLYRGASLCEFLTNNNNAIVEKIYTKSESKFVPLVQDLLYGFSTATDLSFLHSEAILED